MKHKNADIKDSTLEYICKRLLNFDLDIVEVLQLDSSVYYPEHVNITSTIKEYRETRKLLNETMKLLREAVKKLKDKNHVK